MQEPTRQSESVRPEPAIPEKVFRTDVEGLRAVAALLVASFHIWLGRVSGGVDVFFVVTGYFITLTLIGHIRRQGRIDARAFLVRIWQRLAPLAMLVVAATVIGLWVLVPPDVRAQGLVESVPSLTWTENLLLAFTPIPLIESPFQQFWAMSVQGQFYLLWAALGLGAAAWARRRGIAFPRAFLTAIIGIGAVSFVVAIVATAIDQPTAYLVPWARAWEFAIGGIVALTATRFAIPRGVRIAMAWVGLAGILSCAAFAPVESAFPGALTLWPTLSAALILLSGQKGPGTASNAFLTWRPFVWMGSFAFGIYLWHFPVYVFAKDLVGVEHFGLFDGLGLLALSIVLAWASHKYVEQPAHAALRATDPVRRRVANRRLVMLWALLVLACVVSVIVTHPNWLGLA